MYCQIDESDAAPRIHLGPAAAAHATGANEANGTNGIGEANGHAPSGDEEEGEDDGEGGEEYSAMREVRIYVPQEKRDSALLTSFKELTDS